MANLFLLRHMISPWNAEKRFCGWSNVPISKEGVSKVKEISLKLKDFKFDCVFTSPLIRNLDTTLRALEQQEKYPIFIELDPGKMNKWGKFSDEGIDYLPVYVSENLNERFYGKLQGLKHEDMREKYGEEKVKLWRRSFDVKPPGGESLKDTYKRTVPFYKKYVEPKIKDGKDVLIVSSGNALRSIVKYIEQIPDNDILNFEITYGGLIKYEIGEDLKIKNKQNF